MIEHFAAVLGNDDQILDADSGNAGMINAGLYGMGDALFFQAEVGSGNIAELMILQSDEVAQPVSKIRTVAALGNNISGLTVDRADRHTRFDHGFRFFISAPHQIVDPLHFL